MIRRPQREQQPAAMASNSSSKNNSHRPMSIDAMLDMERMEVLALLEGKQTTSTSPERVRSASPYATPRSPVRSMLDIAEEDESGKQAKQGGQASGSQQQPQFRSMLDITSPPASPRPQVIRSMLDTDSPPPSIRAPSEGGSNTTPNSPAMATATLYKTRSASDASGTSPRTGPDPMFKPVDFGGARMPPGGGPMSSDRTNQYQFSGILPTHTGQQYPKRTSQVSQTGKRPQGGSLGEALRNSDLSALQLPGERGRKSTGNARHSSIGSRFGNSTSKSPHGRLNDRSRSPATATFLQTNQGMLDNGQVVDIKNAYRRLSDANLAFATGSLAELPLRKPEEAGEGRLIKDYLGPDGEHLGSSEEDEPYSSDDEDRGRKTAPRALNPDAKGDSDDSQSRSQSNTTRKSLSLLAAAEEERTHVASKQPTYQYKSLITEPEITLTLTNTEGNSARPSKASVHPNTSYDQGPGSATPSMIDSDEESNVDDIKRAQKLSFAMTNVLANDAHRAIRIIYRGEYQRIVNTADEENHRLRKYLVATDLSDESTHALEWAIGTVLRDGDTLLAIYCVDEETGIVTSDSNLVPDDPKAIKEQALAINNLTSTKVVPAPTSVVSDFRRQSGLHFRKESGSAPGTPGGSPAPPQSGRAGEKSKAEEERKRAVQEITDRVVRLLRKTKLQVRVVVEVIHCKNPKHLITEVIDLINPTLVVIGSRGRSALKGVILGSFSNYLVTKSSVPVMVARKRLRKPSKYKKTTVRQVNNLSNPAARSLANAKID